MQKNGGSEGEVNRRSGAQKPPYMATLASHVLSVVADRDIVSCKHAPRQDTGKRATSARFLCLLHFICTLVEMSNYAECRKSLFIW